MYNDLYSLVLSSADYGVPVIESVFVMLLLSWLLLFLSKLIFKEYFANKFWKAAFIIMVAVPSLIEVYMGSFVVFEATSLFRFFAYENMVSHPLVGNFHLDFFPLFFLFTLGYTVNFGFRLFQYFRTRAGVAKANR